MSLLLVTSNAHKRLEFNRLLGGEVQVIGLESVGLAGLEIAETGKTFEENAALKVRAVRALISTPGSEDRAIFADDSGIEVDALGGAPGIYSARYSGEGASDLDNNRKLLAELSGVPEGKRTARYVCVLAYQRSARDSMEYVRATCEGEILTAARGHGGFGYDPLLYVRDLGLSMAELDPVQKDARSHRGQACRLLLHKLQKLYLTAG